MEPPQGKNLPELNEMLDLGKAAGERRRLCSVSSGTTPDPMPDLSQLVYEQRRSNRLKIAIILAILGLSAPIWVPGIFTLILGLIIFSH
jgi:hypothetical protein